MHHAQHHLPEDDPIQRTIRRMKTRAAWSVNGAEQIHELRAEVRELRAENEASLELIAALQRSMGIVPGIRPPGELVDALRFGYDQARVTIDEHDVAIGLAPVPRLADPVGEVLAWARHVEAHREVHTGWSVPNLVRLALPLGHCFQAWRGRSRSATIIVNEACGSECARGAVRSAMAALRLNAFALPLIMLLLG